MLRPDCSPNLMHTALGPLILADGLDEVQAKLIWGDLNVHSVSE